jgi:hypothetical protein
VKISPLFETFPHGLRLWPISTQAFYGIKQNKGGYLITEQTCVVGDTYDDAVTKALYMQPQGEELIILERIAPAYD